MFRHLPFILISIRINVVLTDLYYLYYHAHNGDAATTIYFIYHIDETFLVINNAVHVIRHPLAELSAVLY
jgi:hypothetical protein